jgi:hypothetical protein
VFCSLCKSAQSAEEIAVFGVETVCRAGAIDFLVAFWFDGGVFKLATASVFWILLELGGKSLQLKHES